MDINSMAASRLAARALLGVVAALAIIAATQRNDTRVSAAQGASRGGARLPVADEYYAVKTDWIGSDRSIHTIKHGPSGSCYILVYPSGETLQPVDKDRCAPVAAGVEK